MSQGFRPGLRTAATPRFKTLTSAAVGRLFFAPDGAFVLSPGRKPWAPLSVTRTNVNRSHPGGGDGREGETVWSDSTRLLPETARTRSNSHHRSPRWPSVNLGSLWSLVKIHCGKCHLARANGKEEDLM
jgi:hypothetical protein